MTDMPLKYRRVLLKLSGEALMGREDYGIDPVVIAALAREIIEAQKAGAQIGLVIGGGNIFRGAGLAAAGMDRVTGDHMGMLATVINSLAMQDALEKQGVYARVMSAIKINEVCEDYIRRRASAPPREGAHRHLRRRHRQPLLHHRFRGRAARHRDRRRPAAQGHQGGRHLRRRPEEGTRTRSASTGPQLRRGDQRNLQVMDTAAFALCRDNRMPLRIYDMMQPGALMRILRGEPLGTLVHERHDGVNAGAVAKP